MKITFKINKNYLFINLLKKRLDIKEVIYNSYTYNYLLFIYLYL